MSMDRMDVIFKMESSRSLMPLRFLTNFKFSGHLRTLVMDLDGIDETFKLATLDELDYASNLTRPYGFD